MYQGQVDRDDAGKEYIVSKKRQARLLFRMKVLAISGAAVFMFAGVLDCYTAAGDETKGQTAEIRSTEEVVVSAAQRIVKEETVQESTAVVETTEEYVEESCEIIKSMDFDSEDAYLLAKIAMAEAENQGVEGKALVMLVVLNRVWSDRFPDTIPEVIFQEGQFSPVSSGRFDRIEPDQECWEALELITVEEWDESQGALYFESQGKSSWHRDNLEFLFQYKDHYFYKEREE